MKEKENKLEKKEESVEIIPQDVQEVQEEQSERGTMITRAFRNDSSRLPASKGDLAFTDEAIDRANQMVKSGLLPDGVKNGQAALIIMEKGKEMGFSPISAFEHIIVINGKPGLDGAAIGTLLRRGNVEWEVIRNAENSYVTDSDGKIIPHVKGNVNGKVVTIPATKKHIEDGLVTISKVDDIVTEIKFSRRSLLDPKKILTHTSIFSYKDATVAGLSDREVWKKYLKSMLFWRCLSIGARQFAPDLLVGMATAEELDDTGTMYFDESGHVITPKK